MIKSLEVGMEEVEMVEEPPIIDFLAEGDKLIGDESEIKAFNLDGINIVVSDDMIISIADETVIKVFKENFIKSL